MTPAAVHEAQADLDAARHEVVLEARAVLHLLPSAEADRLRALLADVRAAENRRNETLIAWSAASATTPPKADGTALSGGAVASSERPGSTATPPRSRAR